jgi:hypothetical protein
MIIRFSIILFLLVASFILISRLVISTKNNANKLNEADYNKSLIKYILVVLLSCDILFSIVNYIVFVDYLILLLGTFSLICKIFIVSALVFNFNQISKYRYLNLFTSLIGFLLVAFNIILFIANKIYYCTGFSYFFFDSYTLTVDDYYLGFVWIYFDITITFLASLYLFRNRLNKSIVTIESEENQKKDISHQNVFQVKSISSTMKYFVVINEEQSGPFEFEDLKNLISSGVINADALLWKEGMADWAQASEITEINSLLNNKI